MLLHDWSDAHPAQELATAIEQVAEYVPGAFYRRELPCLLAVLALAPMPLSYIVIDGYVWLDENHRPGLGAYLYDALGQSTPVIGVAKTAFAGSAFATPVLRGNSQRPLYVTAVGIEPAVAAAYIRQMHGSVRVPTALKRVDQLCRTS